MSPPAAATAGHGDWAWALWLGAGGQAEDKSRPTRLVAKTLNKPWTAASEKELPRVQRVVARGDHLDVFLPDGRHFLYSATGETDLLKPLPGRLRPVSLAVDGDGKRLYVLAIRQSQATTAPAVESDARPPASPATSPEALRRRPTTRPGLAFVSAAATQTQPETAPQPEGYLVLSQEQGDWLALPELPDSLSDARAVTLVVHLFRPIVLALTGSRLISAEWGEAPESPMGWRLENIKTPGDLPELLDLKAVSINQQLYVIGWPRDGARPLIIGLLAQHQLTEVTELPAELSELSSRQVAPWGRSLLWVRLMPQEQGVGARRYDPQSRQFESGWEPVPGLSGSEREWLRVLTDSRAWTILALAAVVLLFLVRRPSATIRIPQDAEPARLPQRAAAFLIDVFPCLFVGFAIFFWNETRTYDQIMEALRSPAEQERYWLAYAVGMGIFVVYQIAAEGLAATTLGKRLFRIAVCSTQGGRPSLLQVVIRNVLKPAELMVAPLPFVMVLIHPARQRLGDILAGTIVIQPRRWTPPKQNDRPDDDSNWT